jgi:hypothetical protein
LIRFVSFTTIYNSFDIYLVEHARGIVESNFTFNVNFERQIYCPTIEKLYLHAIWHLGTAFSAVIWLSGMMYIRLRYALKRPDAYLHWKAGIFPIVHSSKAVGSSKQEKKQVKDNDTVQWSKSITNGKYFINFASCVFNGGVAMSIDWFQNPLKRSCLMRLNLHVDSYAIVLSSRFLAICML